MFYCLCCGRDRSKTLNRTIPLTLHYFSLPYSVTTEDQAWRCAGTVRGTVLRIRTVSLHPQVFALEARRRRPVLGLRAASAVPSGAFTGECRAVHCFAVTDRSSPSLRWRYVCGLCGLNVCSACAGEVRMLPERGDDFGGGFEDGEGGYDRRS
jgi:hypothetical protein